MPGLHKKYTEQMFREYHGLHIDGQSVLELSKETGINRRTFYRRWAIMGLPWNDQTLASHSRYAKTDAEYRQRITEAAHDTVRGTLQSTETLRRRAESRQNRTESEYERIVYRALVDAGFDAVSNLAADIYRIDIALPSRMIAIEIDGGQWHRWGRKKKQDESKSAALTVLGWDIIRLGGTTNHRFTCHAAEMIAWLNGIGRRPPIPRINGSILRD